MFYCVGREFSFVQWIESGGRSVRTGSKKAILAGHIPICEAGNRIYRIIQATSCHLNAKIMPKISLNRVQTGSGGVQNVIV